jgi:hypothetical protein
MPARDQPHRIRHLASLGHPLIGDPAYGRKGPVRFARQALHAARLALVHPLTGRACAWESPLPPDFLELVSALRMRAAPGGAGPPRRWRTAAAPGPSRPRSRWRRFALATTRRGTAGRARR